MFLKGFFYRVVKSRDCVGKELKGKKSSDLHYLLCLWMKQLSMVLIMDSLNYEYCNDQ